MKRLMPPRSNNSLAFHRRTTTNCLAMLPNLPSPQQIHKTTSTAIPSKIDFAFKVGRRVLTATPLLPGDLIGLDYLSFGFWDFFGSWVLVFGASLVLGSWCLEL
jgi:hypothetical protein